MSDKKQRREPVRKRSDITSRIRRRGFTFPYGVYPEAEVSQTQGYDSKYLTDEGCFYYQVIVSHERILDTFFELIRLLPSKGYLVAKIHSEDFYHDHDTYLSEDIISAERLFAWVHDWKDVVLDDGFFGIGYFVEGGGVEVFLDEHKTIHVYYNNPDKIENELSRLKIPFNFGLKFFWDESHLHEALPLDNEGVDYLTAFEDLADNHNLYLEEDDEDNLDHTGDPIGVTCWKMEIRGFAPKSLINSSPKGFYTTLYVNGGSRREVIEIVEEGLSLWEEQIDLVLQMARVPVELLREEVRAQNLSQEEPGVWYETERVFFDWSQP